MAEAAVEYLVVAPHPDDAELGMGGTIIKLLRAGQTPGRPRPDERRADALRHSRQAAPRDRRL